ncbi:MAG: hypothetical protein KJ634_03620 [Gammaproteobacteria bacterium]|nr:hypothetical protein [Gammaproteobacteria bacterium]MBU1414693.1 hypothetical protein [Gammaproteobacteria bacterium]
MVRHDKLFAAAILSLLVFGCGGGGSDGGDPAPVASEIQVGATPGDDGVFDPAPARDGSGTLWMSHSSVNWSADDTTLSQVYTRIASSTDSGSTWTDAGVDPNHRPPDFQVGSIRVTWRFEVSRLFYDPYDSDASRRWKMLWHRVAAMGSPTPTPLFQNSWIGYSSAAAPDGSWSAERKLFTGSLYNAAEMDVVIGAPEFPLDSQYSADLGGCTVFTEPGVLARSDGIYVSLQCTTAKKIVLLRCDRGFSACDYLGDLLTAADAPQFSQGGEMLDFFGAPELVDTATATYLIVTGVDEIVAGGENRYSGCLAFRIGDLANATVERSGGVPVLVERVSGTSGSFNGACGYDAHATGSGIIYSEFTPSATPRFHLFASHVDLP